MVDRANTDATSHQKGGSTEGTWGETFSATGEKAKRMASDTASGVADSAMALLNDQLVSSAASAAKLADAMRLAANDLAKESPSLAGAVRTFAANVDSCADRLQNQTVEELTRNASNYTRKQPALVFGLAALAGFFAFRTFKSAQSVSSPPIQPSNQQHSKWDQDNG